MRRLWNKITHGAQIVGDFQARLILSALYVLFVLPIGLLARIEGDPLRISSSSDSATFWKPRKEKTTSVSLARRQG